MCQDRGGERLQIGGEPLVEGVDYKLNEETGVVTLRAQTIADVIAGGYRKKGLEIERLCSQAVARDPFCREYMEERFALVRHHGFGISVRVDPGDIPPLLIVNALSFWRRVRLAWRLLWMRGGVW